MSINFDFSGVATRYNVKCADGLTIRKGAFKHCDGKKVPLVWSHNHGDPSYVLGNAILHHQDDEVLCYCSLNNSKEGNDARIRIEHGDLDSLSICANHLRKDGTDVTYGDIKEVSLCIAGANPSAHIDHIMLAHGEESETEAIIYSGEYIDERPGELYELSHDDKDDDVDDEEDDDIDDENLEDDIAQADEDKTLGDILDGMSDEERAACLYFYELGKKEGSASKKADNNSTNEVKHSDEGGNEMNVFDKKENKNDTVLMHTDLLKADESKIFAYMKNHSTTFKDAVNAMALTHADDEPAAGDDTPSGDNPTPQTYGVRDIEYLFPDFKNVQDTPVWIKRDTTWVDKFMDATRHVPFSRIRSLAADITADEARAKGYVKGNRKTEEVISLIKRTTDSCVVYKKQKIDRQDAVKIKSFGFVAWLNNEMTLMLNEEIARAALVSDGRSDVSDDKIPEDHIRPIWKDDPVYSVKIDVTTAANMTPQAKAEALIDSAIRARKQYKGSGKPTMFTTEDNLTEMLLIKDGVGHYLYKSESELATTLRVKEIVTVPVMENLTRTVSNVTRTLAAIIVNPYDYTFGSDDGGRITSFEQFDIDYNQQKYLKEGICSGALTVPYSALVLEYVPAAG